MWSANPTQQAAWHVWWATWSFKTQSTVRRMCGCRRKEHTRTRWGGRGATDSGSLVPAGRGLRGKDVAPDGADPVRGGGGMRLHCFRTEGFLKARPGGGGPARQLGGKCWLDPPPSQGGWGFQGVGLAGYLCTRLPVEPKVFLKY